MKTIYWSSKSNKLVGELTQQQLKSLLTYYPDHGYFVWTKNAGPRKEGIVAGTVNIGYRRIFIYGRSYSAHRLVWLYVYGVMPKMVDHINGKPDDNRLCNLRLATPSQNGANKRKPDNNTSGAKGVTKTADNTYYVAAIAKDGKKRSLGKFNSLDEAAAAYRQAAEEEFGEFAHGGNRGPVVHRKFSVGMRSRKRKKFAQKYISPRYARDFLNGKS